MALGEKSLFWDKPDEVLTPEELEYYQYSGQDLASYFECMYTTGITPQMAVSNPEDNPQSYIGSSLAVSAGSGLQVVVSPGTAMIKGRPYLLSLPLTFDLADGAITDILLQLNTEHTKPEIKVVARVRPTGGTMLENIKHESLIYEIALCSVEIPVASIQTTPIMLTDQRLNMTIHTTDDKPIGGLCQSIPAVNTLGIWENYSEFDIYIKSVWSSFIADSTAEWVIFLSNNQAEFDTWFATLKVILDGDVAGNLLNLINQNTLAIESNTTDLTTHTTDTIPHIQTLTHAKVGTVHQLSGVIPVEGLVTAKFKATAEFADDDTFMINDVVYTAQDTLGEEISGFVADAIVSVEIDVVGAKLFVSGGGGIRGLAVEYKITVIDGTTLEGSTLTVNGISYNLTGTEDTILVDKLAPNTKVVATVNPKTGYVSPVIPSYTTEKSVVVKRIERQIGLTQPLPTYTGSWSPTATAYGGSARLHTSGKITFPKAISSANAIIYGGGGGGGNGGDGGSTVSGGGGGAGGSPPPTNASFSSGWSFVLGAGGLGGVDGNSSNGQVSYIKNTTGGNAAIAHAGERGSRGLDGINALGGDGGYGGNGSYGGHGGNGGYGVASTGGKGGDGSERGGNGGKGGPHYSNALNGGAGGSGRIGGNGGDGGDALTPDGVPGRGGAGGSGSQQNGYSGAKGSLLSYLSRAGGLGGNGGYGGSNSYGGGGGNGGASDNGLGRAGENGSDGYATITWTYTE